MSERINCPDCQRTLHLPRECKDPWLACPGCAARIRNPQAGGIITEPEREADKRVRFCPSCGAGVEPQWLFCPHCETTLHDPRQQPTGDGNLDVGQNGANWERHIGLLAMFGVVGICIAFVTAMSALWAGDETPLVILLAVLWVLASISAAIVFAPGYHSDQPKALRVVVVTLSLAGSLVAGGCLLSVAGFVFLLAVCLAN